MLNLLRFREEGRILVEAASSLERPGDHVLPAPKHFHWCLGECFFKLTRPLYPGNSFPEATAIVKNKRNKTLEEEVGLWTGTSPAGPQSVSPPPPVPDQPSYAKWLTRDSLGRWTPATPPPLSGPSAPASSLACNGSTPALTLDKGLESDFHQGQGSCGILARISGQGWGRGRGRHSKGHTLPGTQIFPCRPHS